MYIYIYMQILASTYGNSFFVLKLNIYMIWCQCQKHIKDYFVLWMAVFWFFTQIILN